MLKPFNKEFQDIAFVYAHKGLKKENNTSIYSVAGTIISSKGTKKKYDSYVQYAHLTASERYFSNVTGKTLDKAPDFKKVSTELKTFFKGQKFIFAFNAHDLSDDFSDELQALCGVERTIDLSFIAEFFLCHLKSYSPKNLWEYLFKAKRTKISFSAQEMLDLSIELISYICGTILSDKHTHYAPTLRYFLKKSNTLFGRVLIHICKNYQKYFGGLFDPYAVNDTENWKKYLVKSIKKSRNNNKEKDFAEISIDNLDNIFKGLSESGNGFKLRNEQVLFAKHIAKALNDNAVLTIEAGTGTGKTQGYLVPVMEFLRGNPEARVVISTYTKSLQEQIFQKELALTCEAIPLYRDIKTALLKGKSSYICAEKLDYIYDNTFSGTHLLAWLFCLNIVFNFRTADVDSTGEIIKFYLDNDFFLTGILNEVSAGTGCTPRHTGCPAQVVTSEAGSANLVITNHHKLALLDRDTVLSGLFSNYIIDEANHFETAVRNAFGTEVSSRDVKDTLDYLEKSAARILTHAADNHEKAMSRAIRELNSLRALMGEFRDLLFKINPEARYGGTNPLSYDNPDFKKGNFKSYIDSMQEPLKIIKKSFNLVKDEDICRMLKIQIRTVRRIETALEQLADYAESLKLIEENIIHENNITAYQVFNKNWTIMAQWVQVGELIQREIYEKKKCVVYTAATLCHRGNFGSFQNITGMNLPFGNNGNETHSKEFRFVLIPSPFSKDAMEIIVPDTAVSGKYDNKALWTAAVVNALPELIKSNKGRTLVLFSSYQDLNLIAEQVKDAIASTQYPLLIQKPGQSTINLCDEFRALKESVLFGVDTFWYGVDFKGDTLTQVIITRIPFPPPADPVQVARKKVMSPREYWDRYHYDTEIKIKQGIGRLIRCDTDRGKVIILDSRYRF